MFHDYNNVLIGGDVMGKKINENHDKTFREIMGILVIALGIFSFASIFTNSTGMLGKDFKNLSSGLLGCIVYFLPFMLIFTGILIIISYKKKINPSKLAVVIGMALSIILIIHLLFITQFKNTSFFNFVGTSYQTGEVERIGAGAIGAIPLYPLLILLGNIGTYILLITVLVTGFITLTRLSLHQVGKQIGDKIVTTVQQKKEKKIYMEQLKKEDLKSELCTRSIDMITNKNFDENDNATIIKDGNDIPQLSLEKNLLKEPTIEKKTNYSDNSVSNDNIAKNEIPFMPVDSKLIYQFPSTELLLNPSLKRMNKSNKEDPNTNAKILEDTLASFGVNAKVINISRGPVITRYELQPGPGVKVSRIVSLADDIALNLAAPGVRIEAPIPGKAAIGVEVPNKDLTLVLLREILESDECKQFPSKLSFCLGKDIAGKNIIADLAKMPHLLIAGATGSGKSVCINTLIISILYKATPEEVRMIMIDPKVVELNTYNGIPHLLIPVVTDPKKAAGALNWAIQEMTNRYKMFAEKSVRDMVRFNEIASQNGEKKIPQIIVIIDELADLMMVAPNDVEDAICRLAQMARAAGIHLVIATQRPSVDVITGVIKANIPSRIAFAVSSQIDSRTILDTGGAEKLLGRGDMLFSPVGASKPIRVQGTFVSEKEVENIVGFIKKHIEPDYNNDILEEIAAGDDPVVRESSDCDQLLPNAIEIVIESGQASISMIQRRLRVGYARAARLIDEMEIRGIVSGFDGSKPRNVLITKDEFLKLYGDDF